MLTARHHSVHCGSHAFLSPNCNSWYSAGSAGLAGWIWVYQQQLLAPITCITNLACLAAHPVVCSAACSVVSIVTCIVTWVVACRGTGASIEARQQPHSHSQREWQSAAEARGGIPGSAGGRPATLP